MIGGTPPILILLTTAQEICVQSRILDQNLTQILTLCQLVTYHLHRVSPKHTTINFHKKGITFSYHEANSLKPMINVDVIRRPLQLPGSSPNLKVWRSY